MRADWYVKEIRDDIDLKAAGIYEWRIEGVGVYVGKALKLGARLRAYPNNVRRMIEGLHWHGDPTREYRRVHKALRQAYDEGRPVLVTVLENCIPEERAAREAAWIAQRRAEQAAGGPAVLND